MISEPSARLDIDQQKISGFVMAGGRSSRLGQDKVLLPWNGGTLLDHAILRLERVCNTVGICASRDDLQPYLSQLENTSPRVVIPDAVPDAGPLAGIVPALGYSQTAWNLFLAVDLPMVPVEFLHTLTLQVRCKTNDGTLAIIPEIDGMPQPLCGLYHRSLLPGLRTALQSGKFKLMLALKESVQGIEMRTQEDSPMSGMPTPRLELLNVRKFVPASSKFQPEEWFLNVNTPDEWRQAVALSSQQQIF